MMNDHKNRSRRLARERYWQEHDKEQYECPDCGRQEADIVGTFHVHHKSNTPYDNRMNELVGLCGFCHRLRENKKPKLERIERFREYQQNQEQTNHRPHPAIADFINRHVCICSEGKGYSWVDGLPVWVSFLESKLCEMGVQPTENLKSEFVYWIQRIETDDDHTDIVVNWENNRVDIIGPTPHMPTCECVTADDIVTSE